VKHLLFAAIIIAHTCNAIGGEIVTGMTYQISERDALEELEERVQKVDWKKHIQSIKPNKYRPSNLIELPRARGASKFLVDMSYTVESDILNNKGELLYPKGYTFNPLDFISFEKTLVVINGDDPKQVRWFKSSSLKNKINVSLFLTQGDAISTSKDLARPVYYATKPLVARFQLRSVPSVVKASGRCMEVEEIFINGGKD
jgi:conjugal transfer pilus assembly protein TraW